MPSEIQVAWTSETPNLSSNVMTVGIVVSLTRSINTWLFFHSNDLDENNETKVDRTLCPCAGKQQTL